MGSAQQIDMPVIATGFLEQGVTVGVKYQNVVGATVVSGGTGIRTVTLNPEHAGLTDADVVIEMNVRSAPDPGQFIRSNGISGGVFSILTFAGLAASQVLEDGACDFTVRKIPRQR